MEKKAIKALSTEYKTLIKWLLGEISKLYLVIENDGKLSYSEVARYNRLLKLQQSIMARINDLSKRNKTIITNLLAESSTLSFDFMSYVIEETINEVIENSKMRLEEAIESLNNPVKGLTLQERLEKIRKETIYTINTTIQQSLIANETYKEIASNLQRQLEISYGKAKRIARTEKHRVVEKAKHDSVINAHNQGIVMKKKWRNMGDERVRRKVNANHVTMGGQERLADEYFDLGEDVQAMTPGQSGVARHDIHCRCIAIYSVDHIGKTTTEQRRKMTFEEWRKIDD